MGERMAHRLVDVELLPTTAEGTIMGAPPLALLPSANAPAPIPMPSRCEGEGPPPINPWLERDRARAAAARPPPPKVLEERTRMASGE